LVLAAVAAAGGSYFDESASSCGSLIVPGSGPDCSRYRSDRLWLVLVTGGVGVILLAVALYPRRRRWVAPVGPAALTATLGLLAPGVEAMFIVSLRHVWGPVSEEYTGMPDVWAPVALVTGVLLVCLMANVTGLRLGWSLAVAAVAAPVVTLIQCLSLELAVPEHGVTQPARLPLVYPVGQAHPLALAMSGVLVALLLATARVAQDRLGSPRAAIALVVFLVTSSLVIALLVIDASPDVFSFAPLGLWVWAPLLGVSTVAATVVISRAASVQHEVS
jgi:hypothetical protein